MRNAIGCCLLAGLLLVGLMSVAMAGEPNSSLPPSGNAAEIPAFQLDSPSLGGDESTVGATITGPQTAATKPAATVKPAKPMYRATGLEFQTAAACQAFHADGVSVLTRYDRFADILFDPTDQKVIKELTAVPGLRWADLLESSITPSPVALTASPVRTRSFPDPIVRGGINGLTGKGVILAVIDTGIDFHHPDFITYDSAGRPTSRLLYFWDTLRDHGPNDKLGSAAPATYPNGVSIGTIYSSAELTADLRAAKSQITNCDLNGHGTACAGIAAGNGKASNGQNAGVAPEADIIAVRIGDANARMVTQFLFGTICGWLDKVAGTTPLVVSCSFGGGISGHDGFLVEERELDVRFPLTRQGRAVLVAAGNDGTHPSHAELICGGSSAPGQLSWTCPAAATLQIFAQTNSASDVVVTPSAGATAVAPQVILNPLTNQVVINIALASGAGSLKLASKSSHPFQADAYLVNSNGQFTNKAVNMEKMVDSPGASLNAITVGSYNWNDQFQRAGKVMTLVDAAATSRSMTIGELSAYSSPGFLRIGGIVKPEIVAPGQWFTAPAPLVLASVDGWRDTSLRYRAFNGTSAATPYTAGIVALLMQQNSQLTFGQIKNLLTTNATSDKFTGSVPNIHWGHGKLDLAAVRRIFQQAAPTK